MIARMSGSFFLARAGLPATLLVALVVTTAPAPAARAQSAESRGTPELLLLPSDGSGPVDLTGDGMFPDEPVAAPIDARAEAAAACLANPADAFACAVAADTGGGLESFSGGRLETVVLRPDEEAPTGLAVAPMTHDTRDLPPKGTGAVPDARTTIDPPMAPRAGATRRDTLAMVEVDIRFGYDSAALAPSETPKIAQLAAALTHPLNQNSGFLLIGHTDAKGSDAYNCRLSARRAEAVLAALQAQGVAADAYIAVGAGERLLRTPDAPRDGANRRVGISKLDAKGARTLARVMRLCN